MARTVSSLLLAFGFLAFFTCVAEAQTRRSMFGTSRVSLATLGPVQESLGLSDEQKALADELHDELTRNRRQLFQEGGGDFDAMRQKIEELDTAATSKFTEKLDDEQKRRLTEIFVQANGANSLADPTVIEVLEITDEQQAKLEAARADNRADFFDAFQDFQGMGDQERRDTMTRLRDDADGRLLAILTDKQRTDFENLSGEKVDYNLDELRGNFRGGGAGRRGGGESSRPQRPE